MKMHILSGGKLRMNRGVYYPDAQKGEKIDLPVNCVLFRHAQGNVLFDTGCHPSVVDDAEGRWGKMARAMTPIMDTSDHLMAELDRLQLAPDDIDVVINSHYHSDHCGCNEYFKKATFFVHEAEFAKVSEADSVQQGYIPADWQHPMPLNTIDSQTDIFGDDRILLLPLPGHTPGMTGAIANLDKSGSFLLASDAVSVRENLDQETIPKTTWNPDVLMDSLLEIRRVERSGATVICGHDPQQWLALKKGVEFYD
jgi:glyoxylase-like metal-dependent hydrolase (beta-lactamase superfamily II)